jgi:cytochrome c2
MAKDNKQQDTVYDTRKLSKWFAIASIVLLIAVVWAILNDYDRVWKRYTRQSQKIAAAIGEVKLAEAQKAMDHTKLQGLEKQLERLHKEEAEVVKEIDHKIKSVSDDYYEKNQKFQFLKAEYDAMLFTLETAIKKQSKKGPELQKKYEELGKEVAGLKAQADASERQLTSLKAQRQDILSKQTKLTDYKFKLTQEIEQLKKTIDSNSMNLGNLVRNAPVVDMLTPTIKITQVVLPDLLDDYFMNKVPRVDRCMTCHATIDKPGFEKFPQPFRSHPKLDMMVGPDSPHPMAKVGCTVCHAGVGNSVDFTLTAHTPNSAKQEKEWEDLYGYHRSHHIKTHMIPTAMTEGKCIQCHAKQVHLTDAPTFNAGMRLVERAGCYNCHKFAGHFEKLAKEKKSGPSLERLASKLDPEWVRKWLWNPAFFRPSTMMPAFWQTHNNSDAASLDRSAVEIEAITHYLYKRSKEYSPIKSASAVQGDIERGKKIVGSVGCLACHAIEDFKADAITDSKQLGFKDPRVPNPGPELNQLGSKVSKEWLRSWLINPKHYWEGTSMPSMRLSDKEAADVAEYLLSKRNSKFEQVQYPTAKDETRDRLMMDYLSKRLPPEEAKVKLASMSLEDKKDFLGDKFISHYGCYACHAIEGFEGAPNVGIELTTEGSKDVSKFAFENVHIDHASREEWIYTKIRTPRIWDVGKVRDFESKTKMPQFNFTSEQARALATIVIGHENKNVRDEAIFKVDGRMEQVIEGHRAFHRFNCVGCHAIQNREGHILAYYQQDITLGPPNLNTEGAKVKTDWLYSYLLNPNHEIRPWLEVRMPTFQMSSAEAVTITKGFAAYDKAPYPLAGRTKQLSSSEFNEAQRLFNQIGCLTCHATRKAGEDLSSSAPNLANVKTRLRPEWIVGWLRDPPAIMPGTRMPQNWPQADPDDPHSNVAIPGYFGDDATKQMEAIRDFLYMYGGEAKNPPAPVYDPFAAAEKPVAKAPTGPAKK